MGFDLSGLNPKMNKSADKYPTYNKYEDMNFSKKWKLFDADEKLRDKYWEEKDKFQEDNPGIYFRNNCWWWRPLWQFVCERFDDILTEEDMEHGTYNDGHEIGADKAMKIGVELTAMLESGRIKEYSDRYEADIKALPKVKCDICEGTGKRQEAPKSGAGDVKCNGCGGNGERDDWAKSYPFNVENVKEFADFCLQSGGFEIC